MADTSCTARRSLTFLWEEVCSARDFFGKVTGAVRNNKRIGSIEQNISQISGCYTSISAGLYKLGHDVSKKRVRSLVEAQGLKAQFLLEILKNIYDPSKIRNPIGWFRSISSDWG